MPSARAPRRSRRHGEIAPAWERAVAATATGSTEPPRAPRRRQQPLARSLPRLPIADSFGLQTLRIAPADGPSPTSTILLVGCLPKSSEYLVHQSPPVARTVDQFQTFGETGFSEVLRSSTTTHPTAPPKPSTADWKHYAETPSDSATSPTTDRAHSYTAAPCTHSSCTLNYEEPVNAMNLTRLLSPRAHVHHA